MPPEGVRMLEAAGIAAAHTPKAYDIDRIVADIVRIVDRRAG